MLTNGWHDEHGLQTVRGSDLEPRTSRFGERLVACEWHTGCCSAPGRVEMSISASSMPLPLPAIVIDVVGTDATPIPSIPFKPQHCLQEDIAARAVVRGVHRVDVAMTQPASLREAGVLLGDRGFGLPQRNIRAAKGVHEEVSASQRFVDRYF